MSSFNTNTNPPSCFGNCDGDFSDLYVSGNAQINGNLNVDGTITGGSVLPTFELPNGSSTNPSLAFASSTNSGYYWDTSGSAGMAWTSGGTKRMKLNSSQLEVDTSIQAGSN